MLVIKAFGTMDVRGDRGEPLASLLTQSKRAALFAYLVLSRPGEMHRRDALLALFWPELDQTHGRNALSQSLSFLRRELRDGVLVTRGAEEVGVDAAAIASDVRAFEEALAAEDWAGAVETYGGTLLYGLSDLDASISDAELDTRVTRVLPPNDRVLAPDGISFPVELRREPDIPGFRRRLTAAVAVTGRDPLATARALPPPPPKKGGHRDGTDSMLVRGSGSRARANGLARGIEGLS